MSDESSELRVGSNRDRFNELKANFGKDMEFVVEMFTLGKSVEESRELFSLKQTEKENRELKLRNRFLAEGGGELRTSLLKFSNGDEERAFAAFCKLVEREII